MDTDDRLKRLEQMVAELRRLRADSPVLNHFGPNVRTGERRYAFPLRAVRAVRR